ncbi:MAG: hypothetical protein MO846_03590 [Candidatus Devosia symbiotica]|nr:hypothetical protein [Candidatus Devosia symbiotica]
MPGGYEAFVKNRRGVQKLYVIYNGVTDAGPAAINPSGLSLLERSAPTLLKLSGPQQYRRDRQCYTQL